MKKKKIIHFSTVHNSQDPRIFHKELFPLRNKFDFYYVCSNIDYNIEKDNIHIISPGKKYSTKIGRIFLAPFSLLKTLFRLQGDLYQFHDPELMFIGIILKIFGKKVVYDIHENVKGAILSRRWIKTLFLKKIVANIVWIIDRITIKIIDGVIIARPYDEKYYEKAKNRIIFMNVTDLSKFKNICSSPKTNNSKPVIIYSGGLTKVRGTAQIVKAIGLLKGKAELWLMGPWYEEDLKKECEKMPGFAYTKYLGTIPYGEHFKYMHKADFGIVPFLNVENHSTNLPHKPFEYMMCGLPVLMTNFDYWKEIFNNIVEYFFDVNNPQSIADEIERAIGNEDKNKKLIKYARIVMKEKYNLDNETKVLEEFYNKFL